MVGPHRVAAIGSAALVTLSAVVLALVLLPTSAAAQADAASPACSAVGWQEVKDGNDDSIGAVSSLAGTNETARMYAGSRVTLSPSGSQRATLYSWPTLNPVFQPETAVSGFRITDVLATPRRATTLWASTIGVGESFLGPVLGGTSGNDLAARGSLRSWFMKLAATETEVFAAVTEPSTIGVYRWDGFNYDWQLTGGDNIETSVFLALETGSDGRLWLGADRSGVWRSADAGVTWQLVSDSLLPWTPWSIAVSPGNPNLLVTGLGKPEGDAGGVGGYPKGVRTSRDGGFSWQSPSAGSIDDRNDQIMGADLVRAMVFGQREPSTVVAAAWTDGLFISLNGGATWQYMASPAGQRGYFEALMTIVPPDEPDCEILYAAGANGVWHINLYGTYESVYVPLALKKVPFQPLP